MIHILHMLTCIRSNHLNSTVSECRRTIGTCISRLTNALALHNGLEDINLALHKLLKLPFDVLVLASHALYTL